jgi:hypothetical protein
VSQGRWLKRAGCRLRPRPPVSGKLRSQRGGTKNRHEGAPDEIAAIQNLIKIEGAVGKTAIAASEFATWDQPLVPLIVVRLLRRTSCESNAWDYGISEIRTGDNMKRATAKKKLRPWTREGIQILKAMVRKKTMTSVIARKLKCSPGALRQRQLGSV